MFRKLYLLMLLLFTVSMATSIASFFYLDNKIKIVKAEQKSTQAPSVIENTRVIDNTRDFSDDIKAEVSKAVATLSAQPKTSTTSSTAVTKPNVKQTTYIPLSGPASTTSTNWVDAPGTEVYIDVANDYSKDAYITWDAQLKIANASGKAIARLYDVTHGFAVVGSEISVGTAEYSGASSDKLNLWSGKNLYRVQIKSQTSEVATFGSGRIKVEY